MELMAYGEKIECNKAVKGPDYIILDDGMGASFYGIRDFSGYSLEGGEWSEPYDEKADMAAALDLLGVTVDG